MKNNNFKIDFIGIGVMKAASSWIFKNLKKHPEICSSSTKETHFFNKDYNYDRGIEFYKIFFKECPKDKLKGEFTPSYMFYKKSAKRIYKHFPKVKLFCCLRNPIEKAKSNYYFAVQNKSKFYHLYDSFDEAVYNDKILIEKGFYYKQLKRYFDLFPEENILVLFYNDLKETPEEFIQKIYSFLEVDKNFIPSSINKKKNITGEKYVTSKFPWINFLIYKTQSIVGRDSLVDNLLEKSRIKKYIRKFIYDNQKIERKEIPKNLKKEMKPKTRKFLQKVYKEDIEKLEKLINKDLSHW